MANNESEQPAGWGFTNTHWTVVAMAGRDSSVEAREAFGALYRSYTKPLLAFLRALGNDEEQSADLLQGFFEFLLEKQGLARVARGQGRFRSWLLASLKNYLTNEWDKQQALKRGGGQEHISLEADQDEGPVQPMSQGRTPDQEYDRQFALQFLEQVKNRLEKEYQMSGKERVFQALLPYLLDKKGELSHAELGRVLQTTEANVSQLITRLRKRYRDIFDESLRALVPEGSGTEEERHYLFAALMT